MQLTGPDFRFFYINFLICPLVVLTTQKLKADQEYDVTILEKTKDTGVKARHLGTPALSCSVLVPKESYFLILHKILILQSIQTNSAPDIPVENTSIYYFPCFTIIHNNIQSVLIVRIFFVIYKN